MRRSRVRSPSSPPPDPEKTTPPGVVFVSAHRRSSMYQQPRHVERVEDCDFYHAIDLPGLGPQKGRWDLRRDPAEYFGNVDVAGKTILDVGTGSGFIGFEMEKRGANLIAFDFDSSLGPRLHDMVPFHDFD